MFTGIFTPTTVTKPLQYANKHIIEFAKLITDEVDADLETLVRRGKNTESYHELPIVLQKHNIVLSQGAINAIVDVTFNVNENINVYRARCVAEQMKNGWEFRAI